MLRPAANQGAPVLLRQWRLCVIICCTCSSSVCPRLARSHEASNINTCRTGSLSGSPEAGVHPGERKASTTTSPAELRREHRGLCTPVHPHVPADPLVPNVAADPLATIGVHLQHTREPGGCFICTNIYRNQLVLHLQVFWQPRAAIIMSQRQADGKLMAAGMKLPHLPYQVITAEAAGILQVPVLSGCLPGADALPLSCIAASRFRSRPCRFLSHALAGDHF